MTTDLSRRGFGGIVTRLRPPESPESCRLPDRRPESSARDDVRSERERKTNGRRNAAGGWKLCYCEFRLAARTRRGVPIPAAISIGGSRRAEIIQEKGKKKKKRRFSLGEKRQLNGIGSF